MLESVDVTTQSIEPYRRHVGDEAVDELLKLAEKLRGARILHINATPYGGGVAEILRSEVPLMRDLGLEVDWKLITGDQTFFTATKAMHNGLQGSKRDLTKLERETWLAFSVRNAQLLEESYDLIFVHDPQPLALPHFHGKRDARWIWRCHIDTSAPNPQIWQFLRSYLVDYDAAIFTLQGFIPHDFPIGRVAIVPPAIDPESPKNIELTDRLSKQILTWIGIEVDKPLVTQVSRFDPWKDPIGVISAFRLMREEVPDLQLALVGSMALDDPEGFECYHEIQKECEEDPSIHVFTNLTGIGNIEVNAFQRLSDVVLQKSIREGFGLVVSETLWKGTPVVAGNAGGIPLQLQDGVGGFLVNSIEECAARGLHLLQNPEEGREIAEKGRRRVRERFLLTRLIADELRLLISLTGTKREGGGE